MPKSIKRTIAAEAARARKAGDGVAYVRRGRPPKPESERTMVYTVRIPVERVEELRQLAEWVDMAPSTMMRQWVLDRLKREMRKK